MNNRQFYVHEARASRNLFEVAAPAPHRGSPDPYEVEYRDEGCELAPACLSCPLPRCRYDLPPKRAGALLREAQLRTLLAGGVSVDEAATTMGVSRRTVFRLKRFAATASTEEFLSVRGTP